MRISRLRISAPRIGAKAILVVALSLFGVVHGHATIEPDARLKVFAKLKHQQTQELAAKLHLDVPTEARAFFKAAEAGDWAGVSNCFERIATTKGSLPSLANALYVPIHETVGAYATFREWDATMLQKFADGVLSSIPADSIYFGGTDPGRFVITAVRDVARGPDIFIITPKFIRTLRHPVEKNAVPQDALADSLYMEYLRLVYGRQLWMPSATDWRNVFQQYVFEVQSRGRQTSATISTNADGIVQVAGVEAVFAMDAAITRLIFDNNKNKHEFYVEESYVIPWMYPYLEPHGLIMKLNKEPLTEIDPKVMAQDRQFWDGLTKELLVNRHFIKNAAARQTFSKLRSAIAGLYAYRHLTNEAEAAFKQAIQLCPASPEANFRLAQLYMELGRVNDAIAVITQLQNLDPLNDKISMAIEQMRKLKRPPSKERDQ